MPTVDVITMGCSKNLVDSEHLLDLFSRHGYTVYHDPETLHGDIVVVNTCGFIQDAKQESIDMILELCDMKENGQVRCVYVMGCLSERYRKELEEEIPQVDKFYGKFDWKGLINDLSGSTIREGYETRILTTPCHYAYLKISEGCDRHCAYCAIPLITGKHTSRPMEEILDEVRELVSRGVKEFQVIAQEITFYGLDLYGEQRLPALIEAMAKIEGVEWIRLHYAYPTHFPTDLLRVMRENDNVCKYLDIALQHVSDSVLERMQRHTTKQETEMLLKKIREEVPGIALRTTLMVGFCGETEEEFAELKAFVKEQRFERMGAFAYSEEDGTYAALNFADDVPDEVKEARLDELMSIQEEISTATGASRVGTTLRTIIDRIEGEYYIGRSEFDSPDVDGEVLIKSTSKPLEIGNFYNVHITDSDEFDLYGIVE